MQRLNKQVLNGFVKQAVSHNKYLEEREMWKKRDTSLCRKRKKRHKSKEKAPTAKSPSPSDDELKDVGPSSSHTKEELDDLKAILALYKSTKESNDEKWGHSGFQELYPDLKSSKTESKKMSIDDKLELMSEESNKIKKEKKRKSKKKKKKSKKQKIKENFSSSDSSSDSSDNDESHKKKLKKHKK